MLDIGVRTWEEQKMNILGGSAMSDTPSSLIELQRRFPNDAACARYLIATAPGLR